MKKFLLPPLFVLIGSPNEINGDDKETAEAVVDIQKPRVKFYMCNGGAVMVKKLELISQDTSYLGQRKKFAEKHDVKVYLQHSTKDSDKMPKAFNFLN